jgi:hypothetical protein
MRVLIKEREEEEEDVIVVMVIVSKMTMSTRTVPAIVLLNAGFPPNCKTNQSQYQTLNP